MVPHRRAMCERSHFIATARMDGAAQVQGLCRGEQQRRARGGTDASRTDASRTDAAARMQ